MSQHLEVTPSAPVTLDRAELYRQVWSRPLKTVAVSLGMSANGLAKICDRMLVPYPPRGYWSKVSAGKFHAPTPLPPAPEDISQTVTFSGERAPSRRTNTRLSTAARREQIVEAAAKIMRKEGIHATSLKRVAREIGISGAQIYNHFSSQEELLIFMARRELTAMNIVQHGEVIRGSDHFSRITLSTITYLRQIAVRGPLLHILLANPVVRSALRSDHESRRTWNHRKMAADLEALGVPAETGLAANLMMSALVQRAGKLLAKGKIREEVAERLALAITLRATTDLINAQGRPS